MQHKPNKQDERSARTSAALVQAARPLFAQRGFAAVSIEEVVTAASVTRGALYHHFGDKTELFAAVFEQLEAEITEHLATVALADATDPLAALGAAAHEMLRMFADPGLERIALIDGPSVLGWDRCREIAMRYGMGLVTGALDAAMQSGQLSAAPVLPLAHLLIGALDEGALYVSRAADPQAAREEVSATFDRLLDGLRAGSGPAGDRGRT